MIRWLLRGVVLLQLIASGSALESVKSLIVYGTEILPRGLGVASALFACHVVAFAAIFGRVDQTRSRMMVLVVCELAGVSMALGWPGLSRDIVLARSPLPPNEIYGSSWGLGWIVMMQWLGVALSPIPVAVGVWQGIKARRQPSSAGVPVHVARALVGGAVILAVLLPWYQLRFNSHQQPESLVRHLFQDRRAHVRRSASTRLTKMSSEERQKVRPALLQALNDPSPAIRVSAAAVLAEIEDDTRTVVAKLIELLETAAATEAASVLATLGTRATPAVPALIRLISQPGSVRFLRDVPAPGLLPNAVRALGEIGPPAERAVPLLLVQLRDGAYPELRLQAAIAIDRIDPAFSRRCTSDSSSMMEAYRRIQQGADRLELKTDCVSRLHETPR